MDAKTFSLMAGVVFAWWRSSTWYGLLRSGRHHRGLVSAEVGKLGSPHRGWWPPSGGDLASVNRAVSAPTQEQFAADDGR